MPKRYLQSDESATIRDFLDCGGRAMTLIRLNGTWYVIHQGRTLIGFLSLWDAMEAAAMMEGTWIMR
jgi:hypothetical protein